MRCFSISAPLSTCGDQLFLMPQDLGLLHLDLLFFLDLLHLHRFRRHLLLHDVGLDLVRLVGLRLLPLGDFEIVRLLDLKIARGFGLLGLRKRLRQNTLLVGLRLGDGRSRCACARLMAVSRSASAVATSASRLMRATSRSSHVGDVLVLVANLFDGEGDDLEAHLVHVVCAGRAHPVGDHLRLLQISRP